MIIKTIGELQFAWDENKNQTNIHKHGISFDEAAYAFFDNHSLIVDDYIHSTSEERFFLIGHISSRGFITIAHCYRFNNIIRIISAREATDAEIRMYFAQ